MSNAINVTGETFETEVLQSAVPVIVDFWAPWCGPCRRVAPELDAVSTQYGEKAKIVKVNIDEETDLAVKYGVQSIPLMIFFKEGKQVDALLGLRPSKEIAAKLAEHV